MLRMYGAVIPKVGNRAIPMFTLVGLLALAPQPRFERTPVSSRPVTRGPNHPV